MDQKSAIPALDLDRLMEKIRAEVNERKQLQAEKHSPAELTSTADFATRKWTAHDLLMLPATDFARAVYLAFFGREPLPDEFAGLRDRLLIQHVGRTRILREFRRSPEARERNLPVQGLTQQLIWDRIYWSPPAKFGRAIGYGARNVWLLRRNVRDFMARVATLERRTAEMTAVLRNLQSAQVTDRHNSNGRIRRLQEMIEAAGTKAGARAEQTDSRLADAAARLADAEAKLVDHWRGIVEHKFELQNLMAAIEAAERSSGEAGTAISDIKRESSHALDPLYVSFEDRYRGTRPEIKERLRFYVSTVESALAASGRAAVVDIGCGRGEWLELLSESGIAARGFDLNRIAVEESRALGFHAELADGLEALAGFAPESCSAVTAFHIVEHLPFETVVRLLDESLRVLRRGGVLILETPNPANLLVAAERFYFDPTHRNPVPSELVAWLLQSRGFVDVQIVPLHAVPRDWHADYSDPMLKLLQEKLFGPQDYGAIGRKSA